MGGGLDLVVHVGGASESLESEDGECGWIRLDKRLRMPVVWEEVAVMTTLNSDLAGRRNLACSELEMPRTRNLTHLQGGRVESMYLRPQIWKVAGPSVRRKSDHRPVPHLADMGSVETLVGKTGLDGKSCN